MNTLRTEWHSYDTETAASLTDGVLRLELPWVRIYHRLALDASWHAALIAALDLCSKPAPSMAARRAELSNMLDWLEEPLARLEREIIVSQCMGERCA
jgi:hypothetical protein